MFLLLGTPASASDAKDDRGKLNSRFEGLMEEHGSPNIAGQKRFEDGEMVVNTGGPQHPRQATVAENGTVACAETIRFDDGTRIELTFTSRGNGVFFVELEDQTYKLVITKQDEQKIADKLERVNDAMEEQIEQKANRRFAKKDSRTKTQTEAN